MKEFAMIGTILTNKYKILSEIGEGGMSIVFLAEHIILKRKYAVKMLAHHLTKTPEFEERFLKEGLAQAQLLHENIVQIIDYIKEDDNTFLLMDYIRGVCLDKLIMQKGKLKESECYQIMGDILSALNFAHMNRVIHRDIKPSNIIIANTGKALLMDFGIAIMLGDKRLTATGTNIGTSWYMSPEHVTRPREIDHRSDVYSMGIVLYEMLTGDVPFDGETDYEIKDKHVRKPPVPPIEKNSSISMAMNNIVLKSIAKNPDERFNGCGEFLGYIQALKNEKLEKPDISNNLKNKDSKKKAKPEKKQTSSLLLNNIPSTSEFFFNVKAGISSNTQSELKNNETVDHFSDVKGETSSQIFGWIIAIIVATILRLIMN